MLYLFRSALLLILALSGAGFAQETSTCRLFWGQAVVEDKADGCRMTISSSDQPHLIKIKDLGNELESKHQIRLTMTIDNLASLEGAEFRLFHENSKEDYLAYRIPIFADENFNWLLPKQTNQVTFSTSQMQGEKKKNKKYNILGLFIRLKSKASNTVTIQNVQISPKPYFGKGRISITFDDGFSSLKIADQILKKYKLKATAYIIREALGQNGYLTLDELCQLSRGSWEIGSHSTIPFTDRPNLKKTIQDDIAWMKTQCNGKLTWQNLAYPLGKINAQVLDTVTQFYTSARIAGSGVETLPPADKFKLRTVNVTPTVTPQDLQKMAKLAVENGDWLILMFHHIVNGTPKNDLEYSAAQFEQLAKNLAVHKKSVTKISDIPL